MTKKKAFTCTSASLLLLPLIHAVLLLVCGFTANLLEVPCWRDGIYVVFVVIAMILAFLFPADVFFTGSTSISLSICALRRGESKIQNIAIIVVGALLIASMILLLAWFIPRLLEGIASV